MIDPALLRELFDYNPETGNLHWKVHAARRRKPGEIAGCKDPTGRILVGINRKIYKAHRIIWAWMTGKWPDSQIDHINEDPSDNRWINLRVANQSQNMSNITITRGNTSGFKGVSFIERTGKWRAYIGVDNRTIHLGTFPTKEEAIAARKKASQALHGEFAKHQ
jgi:hypothetical protein